MVGAILRVVRDFCVSNLTEAQSAFTLFTTGTTTFPSVAIVQHPAPPLMLNGLVVPRTEVVIHRLSCVGFPDTRSRCPFAKMECLCVLARCTWGSE